VTFATTIATIRRELALTQVELAALLDVDKQSVSNWECGRNAPWPARQRAIVARLRRRPSVNERILAP
jgi:DNA-binding transcriptional regulator YiaG